MHDTTMVHSHITLLVNDNSLNTKINQFNTDQRS